MNATQKYQSFISRLPAPGGGGAHTAIFAAGCHGARAGVQQAQVCADVRKNLPRGSRFVSEREIQEGVAAGFASVAGNDGKERPRRIQSQVAPGTLERLLREGRGTTEADIMARSPVKIDWDQEDSWRALEYLFAPDEQLFCGGERTPGEPGKSIRVVSEWMQEFEQEGGATASKFICNNLSGEAAPKKAGGITWRGDGCVANFRYCVVESDSLSHPEQLAFWRMMPALKVCMLTFSGSKSLHALVKVGCKDAAEWDTQVAGLLYPGYLVPLGADKACRNPARLTRLPGFYRADTSAIQRLLYLCPEGKAVCQ